MKLLRKLIVPTVVLAWASVAVAAVPIGGPYAGVQPAGTQITDTQTWIDINNLLMFVTNTGSFAYDQGGVLGKSDGLYFPRGTNKTVIFAGGFWMGAKVNDEIRIALAEYSDEFVPGPFGGDPTAQKNRVYKIRQGDTPESNPDYADWPFEDGAPALKAADGSDSLDASGNPIPGLVGDMTLWSVFNDGDPTAHSNNAGDTEPLNVEVHNTTFAFERTGALGNCIFVRLKIINKGADTLKDAFVNTWADPDLGDAGDDLVGCDTTLSLGYCYNAGSDQTYGAAPPAVGYDFFQGPMIETGNLEDSALAYGQWFHGFKNLPMTSFNKYINGTDPSSAEQSYNYMSGLQREGQPHTNPTTGEVTTYVHSGDPVTGIGWLDSNPADRRYFLSSGPFDMAPGDSQEVVIGIVVGQGADRLTSITALKFNDQFAQSAFDKNFNLPRPPVAPKITATELDQAVVLTWTDTSEVDPGDYAFEGYNIYQGLTSSGPWQWLATFDLENEITVIFDQDVDLDFGVVVEKPVQRGSDSGIRRYIHLTDDKFEGRPLRNYTDYHFAVTAYSYKEGEAPNNLENPFSAARVKVTPQPEAPGVDISGVLADTIPAEHTAGGGDGSAFALVIDPSITTGHDYAVGFDDDGSGGYTWRVTDLDENDDVVTGQTNQSGDDDYPIFDGLMVKVLGPPVGVKGVDEVANESGPIEPDNVHFSLNSTGDWYIDPGGGFDRYSWQGGTTHDYEIRFTPEATEYCWDWFGQGDYAFVFGTRVPIEFWDITDNRRITFMLIDDDESGDFSWGDGLYIWDINYDDVAWETPGIHTGDYDPDYHDLHYGRFWFYDYSHELTRPAPGTIVRVTTNKINTDEDVFTFTAPAVDTGGPAEVADDLSQIKVVPNPYYAFSSYEPDQFARQVRFTNLPESCTIRIFNLGGDLVRTLTKDDPTTFTTWNLQTENNILVSSGLYVYVVTDNMSGADHVGKMAVFVEIEQLDVY